MILQLVSLLGRKSRVRQRNGIGVSGYIALAILGGMILIAVFAPFLAPFDPTDSNFNYTYRPTEPGALLGTDGSGRDILSRILFGARTSLIGPTIVVAVAGVLGVVVAIGAALSGGWVDKILSRILDVGFAFPGLLLAILSVAIFGPGFATAVAALAIAYIPFIGRIVRSVAVAELVLPYYSALDAMGQSRWKIATRHLLPSVLPTALAQATVSFGYAIVDLAALSFLGLGMQSPAADWGLMVAEGQRGLLQGYWEESVFAGVAIVAIVAAVSLLGDRMADAVSLSRNRS